MTQGKKLVTQINDFSCNLLGTKHAHSTQWLKNTTHEVGKISFYILDIPYSSLKISCLSLSVSRPLLESWSGVIDVTGGVVRLQLFRYGHQLWRGGHKCGEGEITYVQKLSFLLDIVWTITNFHTVAFSSILAPNITFFRAVYFMSWRTFLQEFRRLLNIFFKGLCIVNC